MRSTVGSFREEKAEQRDLQGRAPHPHPAVRRPEEMGKNREQKPCPAHHP